MEVAVPEVEVEGANAVRAEDAGELYAPLDPLRSVVSHGLILSPRWRGNGTRWSGSEGNGANPGFTSRLKRRLLVSVPIDHRAIPVPQSFSDPQSRLPGLASIERLVTVLALQKANLQRYSHGACYEP